MPKHDETTIFSTLLVDLAANEKGKVWPFSTYSVTTEMKGGFSKTFDISPEELRLNFYLNKDNTQVHLESMKKLNERVVQNRNYLRNSSNKSAIYEGIPLFLRKKCQCIFKSIPEMASKIHQHKWIFHFCIKRESSLNRPPIQVRTSFIFLIICQYKD